MNGFNFVLIGAAGFVAPRHLSAIKAVGGNLIAALDPHDSVGVLDQYFPSCRYFSEFERFDRFCELFRHREGRIDFVSICSPNYLHDAHCRFALRIGADAICEKPLVLSVRNLNQLKQAEQDHNRQIWNVLQIRHHPEIAQRIDAFKTGHHQVGIEYITPRGLWYAHSWKGDEKKSGGIGTNIGIHLFDAVTFLFGEVKSVGLELAQDDMIAGHITLERADVAFLLSISSTMKTRRAFEIDGELIDLGGAFGELHTTIYQEIIAGRGWGIEDARPAVELAERIRNMARLKAARSRCERERIESFL